MTMLRSCIAVFLLLIFLVPSNAGAKGIRLTTLYMLEPQYGRVLVPLDPSTLSTDQFQGGITFGNIGTGQVPRTQADILMSPGGKMMATITNTCGGCTALHAKYIAIRVFDLGSGMRIAHFHPRIAMGTFTYVSDDGMTMAGFQDPASGSTSSTRWTAISTKTGRVLHRFSIPTPCCSQTIYDPKADRLYLINADSNHRLRIDVMSGSTGTQLGTLGMPTVAIGNWQDPQANVMLVRLPGVALSPDGRQLAIYDGMGQTVTMVSAATLKVMSTVAVSQPPGLLDRIGNALGLLPTTAEAKGLPGEGIDTHVRFSRDGHSLFVTGQRFSPDAQNLSAWTGIGLERIDLATGHLVATTADTSLVQWWAEAGDSSAIYTLTPAAGAESRCPCTLHSLDPSTLHVMATRDFQEAPMLFILGGGGTI